MLLRAKCRNRDNQAMPFLPASFLLCPSDGHHFHFPDSIAAGRPVKRVARSGPCEKRDQPMPRKPKAESASAESASDGAAGVRAVDRAIAILQCFTPDQPALSVIEIQKRVGLSRPTLYRLLQTLAQRDLILAEGEPQRFRLSHGVMKLSHVWLKGLDVVALAGAMVEGLREATGETAALFKLQDDRG